ncbi:hypothetical protein TEA_024008 [Camellia sinensis var. sinensis]|uniref:Biotin carboxylation domain-containing protein n=1 Tax=Camellia sinensis var. sinensis TaxID=542762 RepID=A0A4S4EDP5_CAMSN|nr:hypothetical protein TEA_024008 [Camellia sinensis var. sinensis]
MVDRSELYLLSYLSRLPSLSNWGETGEVEGAHVTESVARDAGPCAVAGGDVPAGERGERVGQCQQNLSYLIGSTAKPSVPSRTAMPEERRNQKLLEEAPSPALTPELRKAMGDAAVAAAASIGYIGVGTVEFLLDERGSFYFMEMNTRIQVEHPVTEMISSVDLIEEQIRVAMGEKLRYKQEDIVLRGHSIECRINAEDAFKNFRPGPGRITAYLPPGGPFVRMDSHVYPDYVVPPSYDSLLGKLIVWAPTRERAIERMKRALNDTIITGVPTTIDYHKLILDVEDFKNGKVDTAFIPKHEQELAANPLKRDPKSFWFLCSHLVGCPFMTVTLLLFQWKTFFEKCFLHASAAITVATATATTTTTIITSTNLLPPPTSTTATATATTTPSLPLPPTPPVTATNTTTSTLVSWLQPNIGNVFYEDIFWKKFSVEKPQKMVPATPAKELTKATA